MKILITGSSKGIGLNTARFFLMKGFEVYGIDLLPSSIENEHYHHYIADISKKETLPEIKGLDYIFNNAGLQNCEDDISNNLKGTINVTEKYAFQGYIKSVLFNASASANTGDEFPEYVASKAGIIGYMKNVAIRLVEFGATANSISLGGVLTDSNGPVIKDRACWKKIMDATPLMKWMSEDEVSEWVYFLLVTNKSASGIDILIDNGEANLNSSFVWPKE
ncbi:MAG: SDR family oxidoreductase [Bacilli bacterium]|nr:SDR family oxidoreductase [Bacilli bacterium]